MFHVKSNKMNCRQKLGIPYKINPNVFAALAYYRQKGQICTYQQIADFIETLKPQSLRIDISSMEIMIRQWDSVSNSVPMCMDPSCTKPDKIHFVCRKQLNLLYYFWLRLDVDFSDPSDPQYYTPTTTLSKTFSTLSNFNLPSLSVANLTKTGGDTRKNVKFLRRISSVPELPVLGATQRFRGPSVPSVSRYK